MRLSFGALCVGMALMAALLVHPNDIQERNQVRMAVPDDSSYLAHATAIAFGRFPDYSLEPTVTFPGNYAMGPGFLAAPLVWLFLQIDRFQRREPVTQLIAEDIGHGWAAFGFVLTTHIVCLFGLYCNWRAAGGRDSPNAALAVLVTVVSVGLPAYLYLVPVSSHPFEYAFTSLLLWALLAARRGTAMGEGRFRAAVIGGAVLLSLCRYNDIFLAAILGATALFYSRAQRSPDKWIRPWFADVAELVMALVISVVLYRSLIERGRALSTDPFYWIPNQLKIVLLTWHGFGYYVGRAVHVLFGADWGIVYLQPVVLIGFFMLMKYLRLGPLALALCASIAVNVAIGVTWPSQAAWYGYRYFLFAMAPMCAWGLAQWLDESGATRYRRAVVVALTVFPVLSLIAFGNSPRVSLRPVHHPWVDAWTRETYVLDVLRLLLHPVELAGVTLERGVLALVTKSWSPATYLKWAMVVLSPLAAWGTQVLFERSKVPAPRVDKNSSIGTFHGAAPES